MQSKSTSDTGREHQTSGISRSSDRETSRTVICGAEGFRVNRFPALASGKDRKMKGIFGQYGTRSSAQFDHGSCSWRTYQGCLLPRADEPSTELCLTWPRQGMCVNGRLLESTKSERPTNETGCGYGPNSEGRWPTATTGDPSTRYKQGGRPLGEAARMRWPTPHGLSANQGQGDGEFGKAIRSGPLAGESTRRMWPTPRTQMTRTTKVDRGKCNTEEVVQSAEPTKGQLHPCWVEWLMGYPIGWTVLDASETQSSRRSSNGSGGASGRP